MARESTQRLAVGEPVPDFSLPGTDGETHTLSAFDTTAVLVVFTCNHCPYAQAKFGVLNALADDFENLTVVGVNPNDEAAYPEDSFERMVELVEVGEIRYDHYLRDESQTVAAAYGAECTPDPFLLRRAPESELGYELAWQGRLDDALNPDDEPTRHDMREAVEAVLAGEDVAKGFLPSRGCSVKWKEGMP
jgi:peroxiredoxin